MKRILIGAGLAVLLTASGGCSAAEETVNDVALRASKPSMEAVPTSGVTDTNVAGTIEALEQQWVAAILGKDTATIDRLLADDFVGTTNSQRYVKRQALDDVRDGTHTILRLDDVQVRVYGDTAIVDIDQTEKSRHGKADFSGSYVFTDVWVKRDGVWKAVSSHGSRIR